MGQARGRCGRGGCYGLVLGVAAEVVEVEEVFGGVEGGEGNSFGGGGRAPSLLAGGGHDRRLLAGVPPLVLALALGIRGCGVPSPLVVLLLLALLLLLLLPLLPLLPPRGLVGLRGLGDERKRQRC